MAPRGHDMNLGTALQLLQESTASARQLKLSFALLAHGFQLSLRDIRGNMFTQVYLVKSALSADAAETAASYRMAMRGRRGEKEAQVQLQQLAASGAMNDEIVAECGSACRQAVGGAGESPGPRLGRVHVCLINHPGRPSTPDKPR
uniref:Uncharacterized protein n=1 Tax=Oryza sativa subsp. japonica TaxID=39947 RepID=Q6Z6D7_ORYSJ|nr:hypothetical protein [Oryza sativa Japonica Group]BAD38429.1 hypothetical protein [Oryza sativa Japonica Group]